MLAQERANRILTAWETGSMEWLKYELQAILGEAQGGTRALTIEHEERELLESVAEDLWLFLVQAHAPVNERLQTGFMLLRHLSQRPAEHFLKNSCAA
jgi:hypothetical protein